MPAVRYYKVTQTRQIHVSLSTDDHSQVARVTAAILDGKIGELEPFDAAVVTSTTRARPKAQILSTQIEVEA
jgi:hypothetical protein